MTTTRHPRVDAYPLEGRLYNAPCGHLAPCGCDQAACCFRCPAPRCKFDVGGADRIRAQSRADRTKALRRLGLSAHEMTKALGVSRRTVFRDLTRR